MYIQEIPVKMMVEIGCAISLYETDPDKMYQDFERILDNHFIDMDIDEVMDLYEFYNGYREHTVH